MKLRCIIIDRVNICLNGGQFGVYIHTRQTNILYRNFNDSAQVTISVDELCAYARLQALCIYPSFEYLEICPERTNKKAEDGYRTLHCSEGILPLRQKGLQRIHLLTP